MMQRKNQTGSVVFNRRSQTWRLFIYDAHGKRRTQTIGSRRELPTKTAARIAARTLCDEMLRTAPPVPPVLSTTPVTVAQLVEQYRSERMPTRFSTRRGYESWLRSRVLPRWGSVPITDVQPRAVETWLVSLPLAPKSKAELRALLGRLWKFAMWSNSVPVQINPMSFVTVRGSSKRVRQPRSLTAAEFRQFANELDEPFRTLAVLSVTLGLRISEALALKWGDIDWLGSRVRIDRGIVVQRVGEVKTPLSRRTMYADPALLRVLKSWRGMCSFSSPDDWIFASPAQLGRLPIGYTAIWKAFKSAGARTGVENVSPHSLRHTYRSWLDAAGASISLQRVLMRHSSIATTMNYGDIVTTEAAAASRRVTAMAISTGNSTQKSTHGG